MAIGYIYIFSNSAMGSLLKVGYTCSNVERRLRELSGATGVPGRFVVEFFQLTDDVEEAESKIHADLVASRYSGNREFFNIAFADAVAVIKRHIKEPSMRFMKAQTIIEPTKPCGRCGFSYAKSDDQRLCPKCGF